ncbi:hypothetical protein ALC62_00943, partial [Cyphomyrmex costatus]
DVPRNEVRPRPEAAVGLASTLRCESVLQISSCVIYSDKRARVCSALLPATSIAAPPSLSRHYSVAAPASSVTQIRPACVIPVPFFIKIQRNLRARLLPACEFGNYALCPA